MKNVILTNIEDDRLKKYVKSIGNTKVIIGGSLEKTGEQIGIFLRSENDYIIIYDVSELLLETIVKIDFSANVYRLFLGTGSCPDNFDFIVEPDNFEETLKFIFDIKEIE